MNSFSEYHDTDNDIDIFTFNKLPGHIIDDIYEKLNMNDLINTACQSKNLLNEYKIYQKNNNIDCKKFKNTYKFIELVKKYRNIRRYKDTITVNLDEGIVVDIVLQATNNIFLYFHCKNTKIKQLFTSEELATKTAIITYYNVKEKYDKWEKSVFNKNAELLNKYNNDILAIMFVVMYKFYRTLKNTNEDIENYITYNDIKFE